MKYSIELKLNGEQRSLDVEPNDILLDVLRGKAGIKSPKPGCERGDCGSCTVIMNGRTVRACLVLAVEAHGATIDTLEGLSSDADVAALQQRFVDHHAFQCGYCAPGIVLSATELLRKKPEASHHDIQEAIAGNLCRCTGYAPILDAIKASGHGGDFTAKKSTKTKSERRS